MALLSHEIIIKHPTHLFIGTPQAVEDHIVLLLQQLLCPEAGCTYCATCRGLYTHMHHQLLWITPQGNYTRDLIQPILDTLTLACGNEKRFFIVITHAERLQPSSANALLKSLEEPPSGYHFLLTTQQPEQILATIKSRCMIHEVIKNQPFIIQNELVAHFIGSISHNPASFLAILDSINPSDQESYEYLDTIMHTLCTKLKNSITSQSTDDTKKLQSLIEIFKEAALLPPQSGSSKIFWKNVYIKTNNYLISL